MDDYIWLKIYNVLTKVMQMAGINPRFALGIRNYKMSEHDY
jgi:hypothetical protein